MTALIWILTELVKRRSEDAASDAFWCSVTIIEDQRPSEAKPKVAPRTQEILDAQRLQRISERALISIDLDSESTTERLLWVDVYIHVTSISFIFRLTYRICWLRRENCKHWLLWYIMPLRTDIQTINLSCCCCLIWLAISNNNVGWVKTLEKI